MNKADQKDLNIKKRRKRIYLKIVLSTIIFFVLFCVGLLLCYKSFSVVSKRVISYTENSDIDYNVYLKQNDFYEEEYLKKNMSYIASLIKNINVNFNYTFSSSEDLNADFKYEVIGKLVIKDESGNNTFLEKEYKLSDPETVQLKNDKNIKLSKEINIDYDYYNNLANSFNITYGINTNSSLNLYLNINRDVNADFIKENELDNNNSILLSIPLSQKAVNIKMDYKEIENNDKVLSNQKLKLSNIILLVIGIIIVIISLLFLKNIIKLIEALKNKKTKYDKYIEKLLKEYDKMIVETETIPVLEDYELFKIDKFTELIDVRDNVKLPIMYVNMINHKKSCFYIKHENELYIHYIKENDINKK